jgi:hypothetical protein
MDDLPDGHYGWITVNKSSKTNNNAAGDGEKYAVSTIASARL